MKGNRIIGFLKYAGGITLGLGLLYLAFRGASLEELWAEIENGNPWWLVLAMIVGLGSHFLRALRWRMQLVASGYRPRVGTSFAAVMVTYLVNLAIPRGGELARCSMLSRSDKVPLSTGFGTVVVERVFDIIILLVLVLLAFLLEFDTMLNYLNEAMGAREGESGGGVSLLLIGAALVAASVIGFLVFRKQIIRQTWFRKGLSFAQELLRSALSIRKLEKPWLFLLYTVAIWFLYYFMSYLAFFSIEAMTEVEISLTYLALIVFIMGGIGMAIPVPGGLGPYHAAVIFTFVALNVGGSEETANHLGQTYAILLHSSQLLMMLIIGGLAYIYLVVKKPIESAVSPQKETPPIVAESVSAA